MIVRGQFGVLLCLAGCLMANAFYLKFKHPRNKASVVKAIKSEAGKPRYPHHIDDITQWLRNKGRKQLVILDKKDKRVQEFLQELIALIEQSQVPITKPKKHCHKSFGSMHDARNEKVICERYVSSEHEKKPEIKLVIPMLRYVHAIVVKDNLADDSSDSRESRRNLRGRASSSESDTDVEERRGRMPTRFEVVESPKKPKRKPLTKKPNKPASDSDSSNSNNSDSNEDQGKESNHDEKSSKDDSDNKSDSDSKTSEEPKRTRGKKKKQSNKRDNYMYMQGNRIYDQGRRFHRDHNYFMPKRYDWDSAEINHLGSYWFEGPQGRNPKAYD